MSNNPVFIICTPFPRCGTSTVSRLLADFHLLEGRPFTLYETDKHSRGLELLFPDQCQVVDLATTRGQMDLFDQLVIPDQGPRIVEVCAPYYRHFFTQAREIGLFEESESRGTQPLIIFVTNGSYVAVEAAATLQCLWPNIPMAIALNEGLVHLGKSLHDHLAAFPTDLSFQIPALEGLPKHEMEDPGFSISGFFGSTPPDDMSLVVRADLRNWIRRVFTQFHSHELRTAFEQSRYLMRA
jgi:hypothetical protein